MTLSITNPVITNTTSGTTSYTLPSYTATGTDMWLILDVVFANTPAGGITATVTDNLGTTWLNRLGPDYKYEDAEGVWHSLQRFYAFSAGSYTGTITIDNDGTPTGPLTQSIILYQLNGAGTEEPWCPIFPPLSMNSSDTAVQMSVTGPSENLDGSAFTPAITILSGVCGANLFPMSNLSGLPSLANVVSTNGAVSSESEIFTDTPGGPSTFYESTNSFGNWMLVLDAVQFNVPPPPPPPVRTQGTITC